MLSSRFIKNNIANLKTIGRWWQQHPHEVSVVYMLCCIAVLGWMVWQVMQEKNKEIKRLNDKIEKYEMVLIPQLNGLEPKVQQLENRVTALPDTTIILQHFKN